MLKENVVPGTLVKVEMIKNNYFLETTHYYLRKHIKYFAFFEVQDYVCVSFEYLFGRADFCESFSFTNSPIKVEKILKLNAPLL